MSAIEVRVTPRARDIERALWVTLRRHTPGLRVLPLTVLIAMCIPVGVGVLFTTGVRLPDSAFLFAIAGAAFGVGVPMLLRGIAIKSRIGASPIVFRFDEEGYVVESDRGRAQARWTKTFEVFRNRSLIVIYEKPSVFHVVPLATTDEQRSGLDELIDRHVETRSSGLNYFSWMSPGAIALVVILSLLLMLRF